MMRWWEIVLSSLYFDLWWHDVLPLAWPWYGPVPVFWMAVYYLGG